MASKIGRGIMWAVLGTVASRAARGLTRQALHSRVGAPRLPHGVRRQRNLETALVMAVGTGALMAVADVLSEQGKVAARARAPHAAPS